MLDDVQVPAYYILSRSIDESRISSAVDALSITPVVCALITDPNDAKLAVHFTRDIIGALSIEDARSVALAINEVSQRAVLVIGDTGTSTDAGALTSVYPDGSTQEIPC